jgi:putative ABC transport system substrate-binding protein
VIKRLLTFLIFFLFLSSTAEAGRLVAVVLSSSNRIYNSAIDGFNSASYFTPKEFFLKNIKPEELHGKLRLFRPDIILALGNDALTGVRDIEEIPILFMFVPNPDALYYTRNFYGISMQVEPAVQIKTITQIIPELKKPGLIYGPNTPVDYIKSYRSNSIKRGMTANTVKISNPLEFPGALFEMKKSIDHFVMIPDRQVLTPETVEYLMLFSIQNRIPVVGFSKKYLDLGAVIAISPDIYEMGRQAGEMADLIISGKKPDTQYDFLKKPGVTINKTAAKNLGVKIIEK